MAHDAWPAEGRREAGRTHVDEPAILFVGPETSDLCAEARAWGVRSVQAESFIEAILLSGADCPYTLIVAGVESEGQLERAVRALRSVNGQAKMVLVCEAAGEPTCRRALAWGADDYQILPVTLRDVVPAETVRADGGRSAGQGERLGGAAESSGLLEEMRADGAGSDLARDLPPVRPASPLSPVANRTAAGSDGGRVVGSGSVVQLEVLSLPVMVESALAEALLQGRADFRARALATLQGYLPWPGKLAFVPVSKAEGDRVEDRDAPAAVVAHDGTTFGTLTIAGPMPESSGVLVSQLGQAAAWLGGWMALARRQEQLRTMAITDELSGAYNRRYFQKFVTGLLDKARGERFRVSLLLFDIDNFKQYNDRFGHAAGDSIIRQLIALLRRCTRTHDLVARIGGDEFAVVFWDSEAPRQANSEHPRDAIAATERFRKAIENHDWEGACRIQGQVSISGGIATFPWDADSLEALLAKADEAMLRAKRSGKNVINLQEAGNGKTAPSEAGDVERAG